MAFVYTYNWTTTGTANASDWTFTNPDGTNNLYQSEVRRRWNWTDGATPSANVGPSSGLLLTGGYIFTEASSATVAGDQFIMEYNTVFDASANDISVTFYTNQRGDSNNATCEVQTNESNAGWVTRATFGGSSDPAKVASGGVDLWILRAVSLVGVVSDISTRIRFVITMPSTGTIWHNDYGLDSISFIGIDKILQQTHQMMI